MRFERPMHAMRLGRLVLILWSVFGVGALASAQTVTVIAARDPKVVSTFPVNGASIGGGELILTVTFNQPMVPEAWSYSATPHAAFPDCLARPRLLNDRRTFVLLCSVAANTAYAVQFNASPDFVTLGRRTVPPFTLQFKTTDDPVLSLTEALTAAGLTEADDPIMTWNGAAGISNAAPPPRPEP
jgi:hypothetical protein